MHFCTFEHTRISSDAYSGLMYNTISKKKGLLLKKQEGETRNWSYEYCDDRISGTCIQVEKSYEILWILRWQNQWYLYSGRKRAFWDEIKF